MTVNHTPPILSADDHITAIVGCATMAEAEAYAMGITPATLRVIADLLHVEFPTDSPRKATMVKAVVREARG